MNINLTINPLFNHHKFASHPNNPVRASNKLQLKSYKLEKVQLTAQNIVRHLNELYGQGVFRFELNLGQLVPVQGVSGGFINIGQFVTFIHGVTGKKVRMAAEELLHVQEALAKVKAEFKII